MFIEPEHLVALIMLPSREYAAEYALPKLFLHTIETLNIDLIVLNPTKFDTLYEWQGYLSRQAKWGAGKSEIDFTAKEGSDVDFDSFMAKFATLSNVGQISWDKSFTRKASFAGLDDPEGTALQKNESFYSGIPRSCKAALLVSKFSVCEST